MLSTYLNQTAKYEALIGTNNRSEGIYDDVVTIKCRKQENIQNVLTATGQTVQTQYVYYLKNEVKIRDKLDDKEVISVSEWRGLNGEILGYKAVV